MNISKDIHQTKLNDCANIIHKQHANSLSVTEWCQSNGIAKFKFYSCKHKLKDQLVKSQLPDIVTLNTTVTNSVIQVVRPKQYIKNFLCLSFPLKTLQSKSQKIYTTIAYQKL